MALVPEPAPVASMTTLGSPTFMFFCWITGIISYKSRQVSGAFSPSSSRMSVRQNSIWKLPVSGIP